MRETCFIAAVIAVTTAVTVLLRAFPFLLFSPRRKCPAVVLYIGRVLSPGAIAMLTVYCLFAAYREQSFSEGGFGVPESTASLTVILLHLHKGNPLLSIIGGTAVYMGFVQGWFDVFF